MSELNADQIIEVNTYSKSASERPKYYDAISKQEKAIGEELEAFSILVSPSLREEIIDKLGESNKGNPDRQSLYDEALSFEEEYKSIVLGQLEAKVSRFGSFRSKITQSPNGTSTEVAPMVQDIQRAIGPVYEQRERIYNSMQISRSLAFINNNSEGDQDKAKQRESWEAVLSAYRR